jgi:hypothetical protein
MILSITTAVKTSNPTQYFSSSNSLDIILIKFMLQGLMHYGVRYETFLFVHADEAAPRLVFTLLLASECQECSKKWP